MALDKDFVIQLSKLKDGVNEMEFGLEPSLFEGLDQSGIETLSGTVKLIFDKGEWTHQLKLQLQGKAKLACDRCTEMIFIPIESKPELIIRQVEDVGEGSGDDELIFMHLSENEIDLKPIIYDYLLTSIPMKISCELEGAEKKCNDEALSKMEQLNQRTEEQQEPDERWQKLKEKLN